MAGAMRKAMVYLGLVEDDDRYDYEGTTRTATRQTTTADRRRHAPALASGRPRSAART